MKKMLLALGFVSFIVVIIAIGIVAVKFAAFIATCFK